MLTGNEVNLLRDTLRETKSSNSPNKKFCIVLFYIEII